MIKCAALPHPRLWLGRYCACAWDCARDSACAWAWPWVWSHLGGNVCALVERATLKRAQKSETERLNKHTATTTIAITAATIMASPVLAASQSQVPGPSRKSRTLPGPSSVALPGGPICGREWRRHRHRTVKWHLKFACFWFLVNSMQAEEEEAEGGGEKEEHRQQK